jgi:hypothetical protein
MYDRFAVAVTLMFIVSGAAFAQSGSGLASITGTVLDPSGGHVPGAEVVISNENRGLVRTLSTNSAGVFNAPALPPGADYRIKVTGVGFAPWENAGLALQVGQTLNLTVTLALPQSTIVVELGAAGTPVQDTKTDVSQVIDSDQISDLPTNGRRVDAFVLLTPGVTNDSTFGLLTFRGVAGGNSFLLDGNDTTEQYYNENAGRTRIFSPISQDAVQEFEVLSSNFAAEYGRAVGGVVNTVTRSGSNQIHGTAYTFFRNRTLDARDRYATFNPSEVRYQSGVSLGGALVKDKLFYFLNGDFTRRNFPMSDSISRAGVIDGNSQIFIGCGAPATAAQCGAINSILPRFFGLIPRRADQDLGFGRLDWLQSPRNTFSAGFNYQRFLSPNGLQTAIASTTGAALSANADDAVRVRNGRVAWTFVARPTLVNEARFGWMTDRQADSLNPGQLGPNTFLIGLTVAGQIGLGGTPNYLPRVQPNEQRFQYADNISWTKGNHIFKFGVDIASSRDYSYFISNANGTYTYQTVTSFALDFSDNIAGQKRWQSYTQTFGNPIVEATINDYSFYAQDQFLVTPKLNLNYGLRYEYSQLPQPTAFNPDYPQTGHIPTGSRNFAPRIGAAYSLNERTVVRAGFGIFYARFPGSLIANLFSNNGATQESITLLSTNPEQLAAGPVYWNTLPAPPASATMGASNIQFAAPNLRTPYSEQGNIGVERKLRGGGIFTASYIWSRGVQLLTSRDLNIGAMGPTVTYSITDAGGNPTGSFSTPVYLAANKIDPRYGRIMQDENGVNSFYNALALQFSRRLSKNFQALASYTWAHAIDDGQGAATDALFFSSPTLSTYNGNYSFEKGSSALDQRHRLVISLVAQPTFTHRDGAIYKYLVNNWQLSGIVTLASGRPTMPIIRMTDTPVAGMAYNTTINGFGGSARVPFWPVNSLYTPAIYRADARLTKSLAFNERYRLDFTFEVWNITNTQVDTAITNQACVETNRILTLTPGAYGTGIQSGGFPDGTNARRAQVGARLVF